MIEFQVFIITTWPAVAIFGTGVRKHDQNKRFWKLSILKFSVSKSRYVRDQAKYERISLKILTYISFSQKVF